ncbi:MAG: tetratricopeptide repeat protein, partial [Thermoguttaceae bacterium]
MRTLNVRLAAICLVVVVLLGGGVHLLHGFQLRRQANALRIASERAEADFLVLKLRNACDEARKSLARPGALTVVSESAEEQKKLRAADGKNLDEAIARLERYVRKKSKDPDGPLDLGLSAEGESLKEAIRHLESYVALAPKDRKEQLHLGLLYAERLEARGEKPDSREEKPDARAASSKLAEISGAVDDSSSPAELCEKLRQGLLNVNAIRGGAESRYSYGRSFNPIAAYATLEDVLRTAADTLPQEDVRKARRKLAEVAMLIGRLLDAETHLAVLMEETPDDPELLELNGLVLVYKRKDDDACKQFRNVIKIAPTQIRSYVYLADVLRTRLDRKPEADQVMLEMVGHKDNAKSVQAFQVYADYLRAQGKYDEALLQTKRVLELAPEDPMGLWIAGACYLAKGQLQTAEDYFNRGIKADKSIPSMYTSMADVKTRLGRRDEALKVLREGLENTKDRGYAEVLFDLANRNISDRKFDEAEKGIKELQNLSYKPPMVELLEAQLALTKGDWQKAKEILVKVLPNLHDESSRVQTLAYLYLAQCYGQQGDVEQQIVTYLEAVKIDPYFKPARVGLAEVYMNRGNYAEAAEQYRQLLRGPQPDTDEALLLARTLIMIRLSEDKDKRNWEPVDGLLKQIEEKRSLTPSVAVLKAEVLLAKDRPDEAEKLLKECSATFSKSPPIWMALIRLAMHQAEKEADSAEKEKKWKQVSDYIDQAEQNLGDRAIIRETRGSCAVRRQDPQAGAVLKKLGENLDKMTASERIYLWGSLAALSVQANDLDLSRSYSRLIAKNDPTNIRVRYTLCQSALQAYEKGQTPDLQELDECLEEIKKLDGEGPFWLYGKTIRTLVQPKKPDPKALQKAIEDLQKALAVRKDWSAPAVLAGKICEMQDEPDQALEYYVRAIYVMGERDSDVIRRTVQLLVPRNRIEQASHLLDYLEKQKSPLLGEMNQQYVYVKVFRGDIAKAEKDVEKSVAADSKNYEDFLRQGWMYRVLANRCKVAAENAQRDAKTAEADKKMTDGEKAEKIKKAQRTEEQANAEMLRLAQRAADTLLKARVLNPQAGDVLFAIAQLLVDIRQPDKAKPLVASAETTLKGEKASITLAACWDLLNETEKAKAKYEEAVKASPQDSRTLRQAATFYMKNGKPDLAESLFKQIASLQTPAALTDVCWARRSLANILRGRGYFEDLCQGMALIDENLRSKAASTDDIRAKVNFLVLDPRREKTGEAIQTMQVLVKTADASLEDYFTLAKFYLKIGDWTNYDKCMHSLLGSQKGRLQFAH